jgi:hypothetical protein
MKNNGIRIRIRVEKDLYEAFVTVC